jgi:hypothetical protein
VLFAIQTLKVDNDIQKAIREHELTSYHMSQACNSSGTNPHRPMMEEELSFSEAAAKDNELIDEQRGT